MMEFVSWDDDIPFPTEWKVNTNSMVPNHQPDNYITIDVFPIKSSIYKGFSMAMFQTTDIMEY